MSEDLEFSLAAICECCGMYEPVERYWLDGISYADLCQKCIEGTEGASTERLGDA